MNTAPTGTNRSSWTRWLVLAALVIVLDQASKLTMDHLLAYGERVKVLPVFDLILVYNHGAAFSFLASETGWQRWLFTLLGLAAALLIVWLLRRQARPAAAGRTLLSFALALILGGALGNVIDRIAYGHVIDFLLFHWRDWYYPAFNLADTAITCGAVLLIVDELLRGRAKR
ncbi:signal peptidase II [Bordetella sp. FB-8]|uniref:signal peptidase II n=1 Tax=Bordetella sp. FB-8 TaxID=1159870 RepID=UPI000371A378|nr:signal peptidase II [Bordetella sp. FB-8]